MSATASETFGQRVNAVFGGLGGAPYQDESKQWSISRQQVFRYCERLLLPTWLQYIDLLTGLAVAQGWQGRQQQRRRRGRRGH